MDKFTIEVISATENPQQVIWAAMHQDYSEDFVYDSKDKFPNEEKAGELVVKHLLAGNRGHYGCYDKKTEVLTNLGWKFWPEVSEFDNLAAVALKTGKINFELPEKLQVYEHSGDMYKLEGQSLDLLVTLDHRMVVSHRTKDQSWTEFYFDLAKNIINKPRRYLTSGYLDDSCRQTVSNPWHIPVDTFAALVGFFLGDGEKPKPANQIRFRLKKQRKIDFLYSLNLPIEEVKGDRYTLNLPQIGQWFLDKCFDSEGKKYLPSAYLTATVKETSALLLGLRNSDGSEKGNSWRFANTSKNLVASLQAIIHVNGQSAVIHQEKLENADHQDLWITSISDRTSPRVEISQNNRSLSYTESIINYQGKIYCATVSTGALLIRRNGKVVVCGNCIEHPQIVFNIGYFPHSMMQQIRTHRIGISFDVQSFRYTGNRIIQVATGEKNIEDVFYLRPVGNYTNRQGKHYFYSEKQRQEDLNWCLEACKLYQRRIEEGLSEEHARGIIPFDARQHFVMSCNMRSLMHLLDLRWKKDAQLEAQKFSELLYFHFEKWAPAIAKWYLESRAQKARLSP